MSEEVEMTEVKHKYTPGPDLLTELTLLLDHYIQLVNSGDCGHWDPEKEERVIAARATIAKATGGIT